MPLANDADSTVRGGCSVRVSAGAGYFGVMCPVTTIGRYLRQLRNGVLRNQLPLQHLALDRVFSLRSWQRASIPMDFPSHASRGITWSSPNKFGSCTINET